MTPHCLVNWAQYLTNEDYEYLIQYVENIKNNMPNDKMLVLSGPGRTGKSTLKNEINIYLGSELCDNFPILDNIIYNENIKRVGFLCEIDCISSRNKKPAQGFINLIKYKQSFIADTNHVERINSKLLEYCRIITMTHVF